MASSHSVSLVDEEFSRDLSWFPIAEMSAA